MLPVDLYLPKIQDGANILIVSNSPHNKLYDYERYDAAWAFTGISRRGGSENSRAIKINESNGEIPFYSSRK